MTSDLRQTILAITLIAGTHSGAALAQSDSPAAANRKANYIDNTDCVRCHFPKPGAQGVPASSHDFVQTQPAKIWEEEDKHRQAFALLLNDENRELVRGMLGFDLRELVRNGELVANALQPVQLKKLQQCLRCHAWPFDDPNPVVKLDLGVSCQACHGPGRLWDQAHRSEEWRLVSPREKERLHMTDIRNPIVRAKLCASCHVGDLKQERFVTHDMYAKGHPPLPSFEFESFASVMPLHWRSLAEKPKFVWWDERPDAFDDKIAAWLARNGTVFDPATKKSVTISREQIKTSYRKANYPNYAEDHDPRQDLPHTRGAIVAGAVLLQSYLNLLADMTDTTSSEHHAWPEFALFDCTACHHELRTGPLVTGRPFRRSLPGRPPMPLWPTTLVRVGIVHLAGDSPDAADKLASFDQRLHQIEAAMTRQPFGDSRQIHSAAKEMAARLETLSAQLERSRFDVAAAKRVLLFLTDAQRHEIRDYHTARQLAWAIRQIAKDLAPRGSDVEADKYFVGPNGADPLSLNLPAGQMKSVVRNLASSLDAIANYDPEWFAAELKRIRTVLAAE